jgi:hypothetical protein
VIHVHLAPAGVGSSKKKESMQSELIVVICCWLLPVNASIVMLRQQRWSYSNRDTGKYYYKSLDRLGFRQNDNIADRIGKMMIMN